MCQDFNEAFNVLAAKPSVVTHRKDEFEAKVENFINRPDLTELLQKEGLASQEFILIGMTLEGYVVHGTGINFFVANGYPPEGMSFFIRNHDGYCKIIMSRCLKVKTAEDGKISLIPICSDEDVLDREKVDAIFIEISNDIDSDDIDGLELWDFGLAKFRIKNYPDSVCWFQEFHSDERKGTGYFLADIDSGCIWIISETDVLELTEIDSDRFSSPFSAYLFNGNRLIRDEHSRSNGGVGVFFG